MWLKRFIKILGLSIVMMSLTTSCSSFKRAGKKQVSCPKPKKKFSKKFSTKRKKSKRPTYSYGGSSASTPKPKEEPVQVASVPEPPQEQEEEPPVQIASLPPEPTPEPQEQAPEPPPVQEAQQPEPEPVYEIVEEDPPSIADSKSTSFEQPEEVIEFRGQEIDLSKDNFEYEEPIEFIDATDIFNNTRKAEEQLKDLAKILKKNKNIKVTIVGNAASNYPIEEMKYGRSDQVLQQVVEFNGNENSTLRDVMLGRAQRVFNHLVDRGVSPNQLKIETGEYFPNKKQRVVSFIISTN